MGDFEEMIGDSIEINELSTVMALVLSEEHGSDEVQYFFQLFTFKIKSVVLFNKFSLIKNCSLIVSAVNRVLQCA